MVMKRLKPPDEGKVERGAVKKRLLAEARERKKEEAALRVQPHAIPIALCA